MLLRISRGLIDKDQFSFDIRCSVATVIRYQLSHSHVSVYIWFVRM